MFVVLGLGMLYPLVDNLSGGPEERKFKKIVATLFDDELFEISPEFGGMMLGVQMRRLICQSKSIEEALEMEAILERRSGPCEFWNDLYSHSHEFITEIKDSNNVDLDSTWFFEMVETNKKESWDWDTDVELYVHRYEIGLFKKRETCDEFHVRANEDEFVFAKKCVNFGEFRNRPSGMDELTKLLKVKPIRPQ